MTLYLKYRPRTLDELDSASVRESLKKIVSSGKMPHAFLFAGPKGTGKTSAARILAKIINCEAPHYGEGLIEPCGKCEQCVSIMKGSNIDVFELDAASHRGIDEVRALREGIKLSPAKAKKKVYIIDEAHMLTTEAANALLKTLEEPPGHAVFILATTNPERLIGTVRSRTTEIQFQKANAMEIERSLNRVIKGEKMKIKKEALALIAKRANGSFRDAIKILEQFALEGPSFLEKESVGEVAELMKFLLQKNLKSTLFEIKQKVSLGFAAADLAKEILANLQERLLAEAHNQEELIELIELFLNASRQIADSPIEELPLEIAVFKWCQSGKNQELGSLDLDGGSSHDKDKNKVVDSGFRGRGSGLSDEAWRSILAAIHPLNVSIEALLRAAKPLSFDGKNLTLGVFYRFHKERLEEVSHRKVLEDVVARILGSPVRVACTLVEPPVKAALTESADNDIIKVAEEVFGV